MEGCKLQINYDGLYTIHIDFGLINDDLYDFIYKSKKYNNDKLFKLLNKKFEPEEWQLKEVTEEQINRSQQSDYCSYIELTYILNSPSAQRFFEKIFDEIEEIRDKNAIKKRLESYGIREFYDNVIIASELLVALLSDEPTKAFRIFMDGCGGTPKKTKNMQEKFELLKNRCDKNALGKLAPKALGFFDYFYTQKAMDMYGVINNNDWIASFDEIKSKLNKIGDTL